jgi:hypothetical protein
MINLSIISGLGMFHIPFHYFIDVLIISMLQDLIQIHIIEQFQVIYSFVEQMGVKIIQLIILEE